MHKIPLPSVSFFFSFFYKLTIVLLTSKRNFTSHLVIPITYKLKMGDWGLGAETDGWAPSNPHFSEKGNAGADNWNHDSNEPAGNTGGFNDNYNDNYDDGGYKGDANEAGAYANDKCFGCGEEG